jgi:signal transduction histidine kinase
MLNLLSNAVKFTPAGGSVRVSAQLSGDAVEIAVADTGDGIAPQDHAAVFEEFRQVGNNLARKAEGTGLGLPLSKRFVELHGGSIDIRSALGQGSTFTVRLPLHSDGARTQGEFEGPSSFDACFGLKDHPQTRFGRRADVVTTRA